jgi:hypothetical protein
MRRHALASLALLCLSAPALAATGSPRAAGEMREIFHLSGLEAQLGALDEIVAASLTPNLQRIPAGQAATVRHAALEAFSGPALQEKVAGRLAKVHHPQHAAATLRWLRSPLGVRIAELERQTSTAEGMRALEAYAQQLAGQAPPASRVGLARELDQAVGMTDFSVELSLASARAAMAAIGAVLPAERRLAPDKIEAAIASQRELLREQLGRASLVTTLYTYRSLKDVELEAYLAFVRGDAGRWYHGVVKQALLETLSEQAGRMGTTVAAALRAAPTPAQSPAQRRE